MSVRGIHVEIDDEKVEETQNLIPALTRVITLKLPMVSLEGGGG